MLLVISTQCCVRPHNNLAFNFTCMRKIKGTPPKFCISSLFLLSYWTLLPILTNQGRIYLASYSYDVLSFDCLECWLSLKGSNSIHELFD